MAVTLVLVGACQANPEPAPFTGPESTAPAAPPPSASPTPTPPELPRAATGTDRAAAKAFVRHYFATLNYAMNSGDVTGLRALSATACESCQALVSNIKDTYAAGGSIQSRGWQLRSVSVAPTQSRRRPVLDLGVYMATEHVVEHAGSEPESFEGGKQPMTAYLKRTAQGWRVTRLDLVA